MNEHDLFTAIAGAEDDFLLELEQPQVRRLPKHFALIAAMLALILTACAAPVVIRSFDKVQDGAPADNGEGYRFHVYTTQKGVTTESTVFIPSDVDLEVSVDPDAPAVIETHYLPLKLLDYCDIESYTDTEKEFSLGLSMKVPRYGRAYGLFYRQYALPEDGNIILPDIFGVDTHEKEKSFQTYGEVTVLEFSGNSHYEDADGSTLLYDGNKVANGYIKHIFWSDGFYLYCLKIPIAYPLNITKVEDIVTSLSAVEDIGEYVDAIPSS